MNYFKNAMFALATDELPAWSYSRSQDGSYVIISCAALRHRFGDMTDAQATALRQYAEERLRENLLKQIEEVEDER